MDSLAILGAPAAGRNSASDQRCCLQCASTEMSDLDSLRVALHRRVLQDLVQVRPNKFKQASGSVASGRECYSMADSDNAVSIAIAARLVDRMRVRGGVGVGGAGDKSGRMFERTVAE